MRPGSAVRPGPGAGSRHSSARLLFAHQATASPLAASRWYQALAAVAGPIAAPHPRIYCSGEFSCWFAENCVRSRLVVRTTAGPGLRTHPGGAGHAPRHPVQNGDHHGCRVLPGRLPPGHLAAGRVKAPGVDQVPCAHRGSGPAGRAADGRPVRLGGVAAGRRSGREHVPAVNWALSGQASADSTESGNPASNAIDGDAAPTGAPGPGPGTWWSTWARSAASATSASRWTPQPVGHATIKVATTAGDWQAVPAARNVALDPGNPMYVPLSRGTQARYAQIEVSAIPARPSASGSSGCSVLTRPRPA